MYNFTVKSKIQDYEVMFISNTKKVLEEEIVDGDFIIVDNNITKLYPDELRNVLGKSNYLGITATEMQKSYQGSIPIIQNLINSGFRKNNRLVAIGGGITQDVTAFIASILYRGVSWLFFPTTLLAQGDSCIGSKTSINFGDYKNQIGGFYPPRKIFINLDFLNTLPTSDLKSGLGEMCHYFIVAGREEFFYFKNRYSKAFEDKTIIAELIAKSLAIKKKYIEIDEYDQNVRQIFNYGHSFGHAIESLTNYAVPHGIAVCFGMDMANFISVKLGYLSESIRDEVRVLLAQIWADYDISGVPIDMFKKALSKDKKNVGHELRLILNKGYGNIFKDAIEMDLRFSNWLVEYFTSEINKK